MALILNESPGTHLGAEVLAAWREIPPAVISDELNRAGAMVGAIKPVAPGMAFAGEALTAQCMVADNAALHYALTKAWPGAVLVVDARGFPDNAVWGGILNHAAGRQGVVAVVVDGAVRDVAELRAAAVPVFARGAVPSGPHKGWGGSVNARIQCGGVLVDPGDLVVGDDDGVVVVGRDNMDGLLERCRARIASEQARLAEIDAGGLTVDLLKLPPADQIG